MLLIATGSQEYGVRSWVCAPISKILCWVLNISEFHTKAETKNIKIAWPEISPSKFMCAPETS